MVGGLKLVKIDFGVAGTLAVTVEVAEVICTGRGRVEVVLEAMCK